MFSDLVNCGVSCFVFVWLKQLNQPTIKVIVENQTFSKIWTIWTWPPHVCSLFSDLVCPCGILVFSKVCIFPSSSCFLFLLLSHQLLVCLVVVFFFFLLILLFTHFSSLKRVFFFKEGFPRSFSPFSWFFLLCLIPSLFPFATLCPGCSNKCRVVRSPSASSWACLGRAFARTPTLPLYFSSLWLHFLGVRRSLEVSQGHPALVRWRGKSCEA